jgi:pimeloyl-ACP methyl ester carboxylesterase
VVGYGALARSPGMNAVRPPVEPEEMTPVECELLYEWWRDAARLSAQSEGGEQEESQLVQGPEVTGRARMPGFAQTALRQLANSKFFEALGGHKAVRSLVRELNMFLSDATNRREIFARVAQQVSEDTRILIAHSLGSVVAYEALCAMPELQRIQTLVTMGSPLGVPRLVFDALTPAPIDGKGAWPGQVHRWINISDDGDVVALQKALGPLFGNVEDITVHNGWRSHDALHYLSAKETGIAIGKHLQALRA